jgi:hypothetical protein
MEISRESFERFQKASQAMQQQLVELTAKLAKGEEKLNTNTELLHKSTEDIMVLLAFINHNRLQPPKIQSDLTTYVPRNYKS